MAAWAQGPDGRAAFQSRCSTCHGIDGNGGEHAPSILDTLAQRLHDHAISDALEDLLQRGKAPRKIVAIMGGHSMARGAEDYRQVRAK